MNRGFFGIGIEHGKTAANLGTLWRSADLFEASFLFTIGRRYKKQTSDTMKSWRHMPLFHFATLGELSIPYDCMLVGVELDERAQDIAEFQHPDRCIYLLGAEDHGLSKLALERCHRLVRLPGSTSMNVACAGTVVLYDRFTKSAAQALRTEAAE